MINPVDHYGLVYTYIQSLSLNLRRRFTDDDLAQEGIIGVMEAIKRFQPEKGSFSTYARFWIKKKIAAYIREYGVIIRLPHYIDESFRCNYWRRFRGEPCNESTTCCEPRCDFDIDATKRLLSTEELNLLQWRYIDNLSLVEIGKKVNKERRRLCKQYQILLRRIRKWMLAQ